MADLTAAEKAERLGLVWVRGPDVWADIETGATRISRDKPGGDWTHFEDWRSWDTDVTAIDALYRERFPGEPPAFIVTSVTIGSAAMAPDWSASGAMPTPDYRAALEALVKAIETDDEDTIHAALTQARKVLG